MNASKWFKEFKKRTEKDQQLANLYECYTVNRHKEIPESKWSKAIAALLQSMGEDWGYAVRNESQVPLRKRADQRWVKGTRSMVLIEHENRSGNLIPEIETICNDVSRLKVLITYVADRRFTEEARKLGQEVQGEINKRRGSFTRTFLLIVGGNKESDWVAFRSVPQVRMKKIE